MVCGDILSQNVHKISFLKHSEYTENDYFILLIQSVTRKLNIQKQKRTYLLVGRSAFGKKLFFVSMFKDNWTPPLRTKLY